MFDHSTNKYIFLDIDGVMNNEFDILEKMHDEEKRYSRDDIHFCDEAWDLLATLCKKTGAKVILSSSWRHGFVKDERGRIVVANQENHLATRLLAYFKAHHIPLVGLTGLGRDGCRGLQILDYVAENLNGMTDEWIVLDDEIFDMEEHLPMGNVFQTKFKTGLTLEICNCILDHWGWEEDVYVFFTDSILLPEHINPVYNAAPNGILMLNGRYGFKENYIDYCREKCFNQEHGAPLYIVTNMPYFLEKAYFNRNTNLFHAYIWSEEDECYHNVQKYTDRELRAGYNLHTLYVNGALTDNWGR